jgi:hypothetical protein
LPDFNWSFLWPHLPSIDLYWPQIELAFPSVDWPSIRLDFPDFDWPNLYNMFPDFDWPSFFLSLPDIDWPSIFLEMPNFGFDWPDLYNMFPDFDWPSFFLDLPNIDWTGIFMDWPDIWDILSQLNVSWPSLDLPDLSLDLPSPNFDLTFNEIDIDYVIDPSISYGGFLFVAIKDTKSNGEKFKGEGALEMMFASSGGLSSVKFKMEVGMLNDDPQEKGYDSAQIYGIGCIAYSSDPTTFIADLGASVETSSMCMQGYVHLHFSPDVKEIFLGTRQNRIGVVPGCNQFGVEGWLQYSDKPSGTKIGIGLGLGYYFKATSKRINLGVCKIKGVASANIRATVFTDFELGPFRPLTVGMEFSAQAGIDVNFSGWLCRFGDVELASVYLGGDLVYSFEDRLFTGRISGRAKVAVFSVGFKFDYEKEMSLPF